MPPPEPFYQCRVSFMNCASYTVVSLSTHCSRMLLVGWRAASCVPMCDVTIRVVNDSRCRRHFIYQQCNKPLVLARRNYRAWVGGGGRHLTDTACRALPERYLAYTAPEHAVTVSHLIIRLSLFVLLGSYYLLPVTYIALLGGMMMGLVRCTHARHRTGIRCRQCNARLMFCGRPTPHAVHTDARVTCC